MEYTVQDLTEEVNPDVKEHYWENCPHGCADDECEGHIEDKDRLFIIDGIFDRHDGEGAGYFSKERADLLAAFLAGMDTFIPEFPNEAGPGNPVIAVDLQTQEKTTLRWSFDPPIQQSRMMTAIGRLGVMLQIHPAFELPPQEAELFNALEATATALTFFTGFPSATPGVKEAREAFKQATAAMKTAK